MTDTDLMALDATEQAAKVQSGEMSAKQLVEATLARIEAVDPLVNAYRVVLAREALAEADRIDSMADVERSQMQLAGVPVAIKDGGGSVRYPAGLTGLVGLKPQRDRVPLGAEHASGWHGLIALGPLARSVRDAALFLDVTGHATRSTRFTDALSAGRRSLRIAVSTNTPPGSQVSLSADRRQQVDAAAELLGELGHEMTTADISYGLASLWNSTVRLLKGAQEDVASMPDRRQLEARTRSVARMGRLIPTRSLSKALRNEQRRAASINSVFDHADVVLTPLCEAPAPSLDRCPTRGASRSLRAPTHQPGLSPGTSLGNRPSPFPQASTPMACQRQFTSLAAAVTKQRCLRSRPRSKPPNRFRPGRGPF